MPVTTAVESLYVHVPFCARKCEYCAFYSEASTGAVIHRYVRALAREFELVAPDLRPRTIFFGGGTPSLLNLQQWETVLRALQRLNLLGAAEFTVECNPATISLDKARLLRAFGVNRISMGVQSFDEDLLQRLGRVHSRAMVFKSFNVLRQAGFENINLDLMFALPGQTMEVWRATLDEALALGSEHLSCYEVIYEEDTPLYAQMQAGRFEVNEELAAGMFEELVARTAAAGFQQYEIANFARTKPSGRGPGAPPHPDPLLPALACRHNVNYWRGGDFYGLGPSATSYVRGRRTKNWASTRLYCEQLEAGRRAIESQETLPPLQRAGETAAFGLRMNAGWPFDDFEHVTGMDLRRDWAADMAKLVRQGWAQLSAERFRLTPQGLRFADAAAAMFLR
ncbi:MAG TPA: radical SAM family heme chaperone HemW [Verrucomicrobiota bacterium]|nr:radical SAM family heme chaperone HemW [Verrucomicrobiota bacterium]HNT15981.1 radical SAM family heme chaperone HemW [Verrucomicrobiota bacterium]